MASFVARFECAVCQGTATHPTYAALTCGHAYHTECISGWLAQGTKTCPTCRAHASARSILVLVGVETVPLADGDSSELAAAVPQTTGGCACSGELRLQLAEKQEQAATLAAQLSEAQEHAGELEHTAGQLLQQQHTLTHKLKATKAKVADLEAGRVQDAKRLTEATQELGQWQERYRSDTVRMKRQLQDEAGRTARAEANLRRLLLQNPSLSLQGIQAILSSGESEQGQLSALLAQRNQQLQEAQARVAELQAQLADQQRATEAEAEAASSRSKAAAVRAAREKEEAMKAVLQLEFANGKLQAENGSLRRLLQELQQVLLALQEGELPGPQQRQQQQRPLGMPVQPARQQEQHRQGSDQQQQQERWQQQQQYHEPDPGEDDAWLTEPPVNQQQQQQDLEATQLDVAAVVGRLQPLSVASAPSFMRQQHQQAAARPGGVTGQFLRAGPDGRGGTARHGTTSGHKRAAPSGPHHQAGSRKRQQPAVQAGAGSIRAFFGAAATRR